MSFKKLNIRVIASILVLTLVIPFFTTFFEVEASDVRSSVSANVSKYAVSADASNLTIYVSRDIAVYSNAGDANNRANAVKTYPSGSYSIYKSVDGSFNITKEPGQPGGWINVRDLDKVSVKDESPSYKEEPKTNNTSSSSSTSSSSEVYVLKASAKAHINSDDAVRGVNARGTLAPGDYYVYKTYGKAVNITKDPGVPGAWIVSTGSVQTNTSTPKPAAPKPAVPKTNTTTKVTTTANTPLSNGQVRLSATSNIYMNAADAVNGTNDQGTWDAGVYYVFKTYGNATNITRTKGQPGAWVPNKVVSGTTQAPAAPKPAAPKPAAPKPAAPKPAAPKPAAPKTNTTTTTKATTNSIVVDSSRIKLNSSVRIYMNAENAVKQVNPAGTWSAGTYYIYKTVGNAINITTEPGQPGGWIAGGVRVEAPVTPKPAAPKPAAPKSNTTITKTTSSNKTSTKQTATTGQEISNEVLKAKEQGNFVLVFDPGHGPGIESNRGGLLFNEGDQNFIFTEMIRKSAKRYSNLVTLTTRPVNDLDPTGAERAEAGNGSDLYVSIHTNAFTPNVRGVELYGSNDNEKLEFGKEIARTWSQVLDTPNRGVKYAHSGRSDTSSPVKGSKDPWFVFKENSSKEKYILESVFHTNIDDSRAFLKNQEVLADKFMDIVAKHFNLKLK